MSGAQVEIQVIAVVTAAACALPGVFLVLRRLVLMSDAISHAILLGIVLAFFFTHDLTSPFLVAAAAATGLLTVILVEALQRSRLVKEDAAIGLVFPALFSLGVILISRYAGSIHLDTDTVLLGELAYAPFDRLEFSGYDFGPRSLGVMLGILALNVIFIAAFYKELKLTTFDSGLSAAIGFSPVVINYALMSLVSITVVGAFDAVGSILVVALMVTPPATAFLLTSRLARMIWLSVGLGALSAVCGYWMAHLLDISIAGSMTVMAGIFFALAILFSPEKGIITALRRRRRVKMEFARTMLAIHLSQHEGRPEEIEESRVTTIHRHLHWDPVFTEKIISRAIQDGLIRQSDGHLSLTEEGRQLTHTVMAR